MKFSLCIEMAFTELDFYDRIRKAKEVGCDAIEFWEPWIYGEVDPKKIGEIAGQVDIPVAAFCLSQSGDCKMNSPWPMIKSNLEHSLEIAKSIGCKTLIALAGNRTEDQEDQKVILTENLKRAAEMAEKAGVTIVLEALNSLYNHKGYYLDSSYLGFEIIKAVDSPSVKLLYDCYHMQLMEGNLVHQITENCAHIGHFHCAGVPGRDELQKGEVHYPFVLEAAKKAGYDGYFGLEYSPTYDSEQSVKDVLKFVRGEIQ